MRFLLPLVLCAAAGADSDELEKRLADLEQQVERDKAEIARLKSAHLEREIEGYLELTGEGEIPESTVGYDNEFFLRSRDGRYRLSFGLYTQIRYEVNGRGDALESNDRTATGWDFGTTEIYARAELTTEFEIQFRMDFGDGGTVDLVEAYLRWLSASGWTVTVGQQFIGHSREDWMYAEDTLAAEFSANAAVFGLKSSLGVQGFRQGRQHRGWLAFSNGRSGNRTGFTEITEAEWSISGRWEWQLAGEDWTVWSDLVGRRGRPFGTLFGLAALAEGGVENAPFTEGFQVTTDLSINGDGYQALIAVTMAQSMDTAAPNEANFTSWGVLAQGGWFFAERWQLWAQYDGVFAGSRADFSDFNAVGIGVNFFPIPSTNRQKFTIECKYLFDAINDTLVSPSPDLGWMASDEPGQFLLRLQLQFGF